MKVSYIKKMNHLEEDEEEELKTGEYQLKRK